MRPCHVALAFASLICPGESPQDDPGGRPAGGEKPILPGHYRVASFEVAETANLMVMEGLIEAPDGSTVVFESVGPGIRTHAGIRSHEGGATGEFRFLAILDRAGVMGKWPSPGPEGWSTLSLYSRTGTGGGGSTRGYTAIPPDQPLRAFLRPLLAIGDLELGETADVFRAGDQMYMIRVTGPAPRAEAH